MPALLEGEVNAHDQDLAAASRTVRGGQLRRMDETTMTTQFVPRPVGVDELRRAWHAVQAGEFRATGVSDSTRRRPPRPDTTQARIVWTPPVGELSLIHISE